MSSFSSSLRSLEDRQKHINSLIQQLSKPTTSSSNTVTRTDLSTEIHDLLKEQSDRLDYLRQDVDEIKSKWANNEGRRTSGQQSRQREELEQERERNVSTFARLDEDLKIAHRQFRRAQVDAKRAEEAARRREREELFAKRRKDGGGSLTVGSLPSPPKLSQDEIAVNAANDVTRSLRRTHALLESNLEQSQFAMQTLEESSQALAGLGEKYSGLEGMLKTSRGLMTQLYRSQKSDTWYLETAFYILLCTIAWLVFRRLLFGPGWWLVYLPLKMLWRLSVLLFGGAVGMVAKSRSTVNGTIAQSLLNAAPSRPTMSPGMWQSVQLPNKGGGWARQPVASVPSEEEEKVVDQIGKMAENIKKNFGSWKDLSAEGEDDELQEQDSAVNTKKRMMEVDVETQPPPEPSMIRDEL